MTILLNDRLNRSILALDNVASRLAEADNRLHTDAVAFLRDVTETRPDLKHCLNLLKAREASWKILDGLELRVDSSDCVVYTGAELKFEFVRLIGVQAYVSTEWALADSITSIAGRVFCTYSTNQNKIKPPQLISDFLGKEANSNVAKTLRVSLQASFGRAASILYALRNHFLHDGAYRNGMAFFSGTNAESAFRVSESGWKQIERRAQSWFSGEVFYSKLCRPHAVFPTDPKDDLRELLRWCEREIDEALGIIISTATQTVLVQTGFMLGDDEDITSALPLST